MTGETVAKELSMPMDWEAWPGNTKASDMYFLILERESGAEL
jgi:hypothetical protein